MSESAMLHYNIDTSSPSSSSSSSPLRSSSSFYSSSFASTSWKPTNYSAAAGQVNNKSSNIASLGTATGGTVLEQSGNVPKMGFGDFPAHYSDDEDSPLYSGENNDQNTHNSTGSPVEQHISNDDNENNNYNLDNDNNPAYELDGDDRTNSHNNYITFPEPEQEPPCRDLIVGDPSLMPKLLGSFAFPTQQATGNGHGDGPAFEGCYCDYYGQSRRSDTLYETEPLIVCVNSDKANSSKTIIDYRYETFCYCVGPSITALPSNFSGNVHKM